MIHFTIPSYNDTKTITNTQRIIEGGYYGGKTRITDYAILKGAGSFTDIFTKYRVYPYWLQNETDDYTNHDDLYYGISPAQAVAEGSDRYAYSEDKTVGTRLMTDYEHMIISAVRYALGRMTYIVGLTVDYVLKDIEENKLSRNCLSVIKKDIESEKDLGMECDKKDWCRLLNKINEVLEV